jgi:hypothetical protein
LQVRGSETTDHFGSEPLGSLVEAIDQSADHSGDDFEALLESEGCGVFDEPSPPGDFQKRNTLLSRAASDCEEATAIGLPESTVPCGPIGGDRGAGEIELKGEKSMRTK